MKWGVYYWEDEDTILLGPMNWYFFETGNRGTIGIPLAIFSKKTLKDLVYLGEFEE